MIVGHDHVDVAVVVEVPEGGAAARVLERECRPAVRAPVAPTVVQPELVALAQGRAGGCGELTGYEADGAVGGEEVAVAVVVDVHPAGAETRKREALGG